ncbi:MAG: 50S ribosomal protein L11 methyltransferase [Candidatus Nanoarchaeia archaeon]|nr:50S ribosomal protein L11 methyltransferase [Candidatus Nanoarchaeia archaeon]
MFEVYEPMEDSLLLEKHVKKYSKNSVLDMGTGSGIQAIAASENADFVVALDISDQAVQKAKSNIKKQGIKNIFVFKSDLFSFFSDSKLIKNIKKTKIKNFLLKKPKFQLIIFNPPYLPKDEGIEDKSIYGGIKGHETLEKFFSQVGLYLKEKGKILIVFSSLTNKDKVDSIINKYGFEFKKIDEEKISFETLFAYLIEKSEILKNLEKKNLKEIKVFAKGHRGLLYRAKLNKKDVVIKKKLPESKAKGRIENETKWIKTLNEKNIGPKLLFSGQGYFVYNFVKGKFIVDFIEKSKKQDIIKVIKDVFMQLYKMDRMNLDKEEMHHPLKHIIVDKKPIMIDFERCRKTKKPKNVTQFCQFITSTSMKQILNKKNIKIKKDDMIKLAIDYKKEMSKKNLDKILNLLK